MKEETFKIKGSEDNLLYLYKWTPERNNPTGIVQIAHGMAEHAARYRYFAQKLCEVGYIVYANDHRGHGQTAGDVEELGYLGEGNGFRAMVEDLHMVNRYIRQKEDNLPIVLFGHSMGSFISQRYIQLYGDTVNKVVLSGSNGQVNFLADVGIFISFLEMKLKGRKAKSPLMDKLIFGGFNKKFMPAATPFAWITSDEEELQKYLNDPYAGFVCTTSFYHYLLRGLKERQKKENLSKVPKEMPILLVSGDEDPVGYFGKGVKNLYQMYKDAQVKNVEMKLYPKGRHEILNEVNKDEVIEDIITWLKKE
ncbi:alpha/beta hydrolase [Clostridium polynesiense]|uniref:alpha/beta hydrolase n=1 Tax=Clostridium polynesiense TaxID=1325933 RepID=UPI00058D398A|nr:alpha/beta hydrolase [Clostridium polynesiense]